MLNNKMLWCTLSLLLLAVMLVACNKSSSAAKPAAAKQEAPVTIGGQPVVTLTRKLNVGNGTKPQDGTRPQFVEAVVAPGSGMNLLKLTAFVPGMGQVDLIKTGNLPDIKKFLEDPQDEFGYNNFKVGSAILVPWANRIRGKLLPDGKHIESNVAGKKLILPGGFSGKNPGAEKHAIHGLILKSAFQDVAHQDGAAESTLSGNLHAGDFGVKWPSQTDVSVQTVLKDDSFEVIVVAKNVGNEVLPMGIAAHPYYMFPSGDRKQAKLQLPPSERAPVNNYDDVFPTGKIVPVKGTEYDFTAPGGKALGELFLDDNFPNPKRDANGNVVVEITDPAAKYGLRITSPSPEVSAIQIYAPVDKPFIAIEPQFNLNDPFIKAWGKKNGMVMLKPGESVTWRMKLELFIPGAAPSPNVTASNSQPAK